MYKRGGNGAGSCLFRMRLRSRMRAKQFLDMFDMCSDNEILESKITLRLRAEETGFSLTSLEMDIVGLLILAS